MAKVNTNISFDSDLTKARQELCSDFGQSLPFAVTREVPNTVTMAAMNEYDEIKSHPEKYKKYSSFQDALSEVPTDA